MTQCKGKRKDGNRCRSTKVMPNGYCFSHQDQNLDSTSSLTKPVFKIIGAIVAVTSVFLTWYFGFFGATKVGQEKSHNNQAAMQGQLNDVEQLLRLRDVAEELYKDEFLSKYDLGYCLIAINKYKRLVSTPKASIEGYEIDWSTFNVHEYIPGKIIVITSPKTISPKGNRQSETKISLNPKSKKIHGLFFMADIGFYIQIVSENPDGVIVLFGLSSRPLF